MTPVPVDKHVFDSSPLGSANWEPVYWVFDREGRPQVIGPMAYVQFGDVALSHHGSDRDAAHAECVRLRAVLRVMRS
jgi:hypothetical protein